MRANPVDSLPVLNMPPVGRILRSTANILIIISPMKNEGNESDTNTSTVTMRSNSEYWWVAEYTPMITASVQESTSVMTATRNEFHMYVFITWVTGSLYCME